jgi:hypothetical protein
MMIALALIAGLIIGGCVVYVGMLLDAYEGELERRFKASANRDEEEVVYGFGSADETPDSEGVGPRDPLNNSTVRVDLGEKSKEPGCSDPAPHLRLVTDREK